jgi:hypothetical protein
MSAFPGMGPLKKAQVLLMDRSLVAVRAALCQSRASVWVQLWVHYGSNKRCVGLFPAL